METATELPKKGAALKVALVVWWAAATATSEGWVGAAVARAAVVEPVVTAAARAVVGCSRRPAQAATVAAALATDLRR
jgi:hypothetical protein